MCRLARELKRCKEGPWLEVEDCGVLIVDVDGDDDIVGDCDLSMGRRVQDGIVVTDEKRRHEQGERTNKMRR